MKPLTYTLFFMHVRMYMQLCFASLLQLHIEALYALLCNTIATFWVTLKYSSSVSSCMISVRVTGL